MALAVTATATPADQTLLEGDPLLIEWQASGGTSPLPTWTKTELGAAYERCHEGIVLQSGRILVGTGTGSTDAKILSSDDNGATFQTLYTIPGTTAVVYSFCQLDDGAIFALVRTAQIYKSVDNGDNWVLVVVEFTASNECSRLRTNGTNLLVATIDDNAVWVSSDGGSSFSQKTIPQVSVDDWTYGLAIGLNDRIIVGTSQTSASTQLLYSDDFGANWTSAKSTGLGDVYSIYHAGGGVLYASTTTAKIWRSVDNGSTWGQLPTIGNAFRSVFAISDIILCSTGSNTEISYDNGATFQTTGVMDAGTSACFHLGLIPSTGQILGTTGDSTSDGDFFRSTVVVPQYSASIKKDLTEIATETNATGAFSYSKAEAELTDADTYEITVSNNGVEITDSVTITVESALSVSVTPTKITIVEGTPYELTCTPVTGATYSWMMNGKQIGTNSNILSMDGVILDNTKSIYCQVTTDVDSAASNSVPVLVGRFEMPPVTTVPTSVTVDEGTTVEFSAEIDPMWMFEWKVQPDRPEGIAGGVNGQCLFADGVWLVCNSASDDFGVGIYRSTNGIDFDFVETFTTYSIRDIAYGNGVLVGIHAGDSNTGVWYSRTITMVVSSDLGLTWTQTQQFVVINEFGTPSTRVFFDGTRFVMNIGVSVYVCPDNSGLFTAVTDMPVYGDILFHEGTYFVSGGNQVYRSTNLLTWSMSEVETIYASWDSHIWINSTGFYLQFTHHIENTVVYRSLDSGLTFEPDIYTVTSSSVRVFKMVDDTFYADSGGSLLYSNDFDHWVVATTVDANEINYYSAGGFNQLYMNDNKEVFRSYVTTIGFGDGVNVTTYGKIVPVVEDYWWWNLNGNNVSPDNPYSRVMIPDDYGTMAANAVKNMPYYETTDFSDLNWDYYDSNLSNVTVTANDIVMTNNITMAAEVDAYKQCRFAISTTHNNALFSITVPGRVRFEFWNGNMIATYFVNEQSYTHMYTGVIAPNNTYALVVFPSPGTSSLEYYLTNAGDGFNLSNPIATDTVPMWMGQLYLRVDSQFNQEIATISVGLLRTMFDFPTKMVSIGYQIVGTKEIPVNVQEIQSVSITPTEVDGILGGSVLFEVSFVGTFSGVDWYLDGDYVTTIYTPQYTRTLIASDNGKSLYGIVFFTDGRSLTTDLVPITVTSDLSVIVSPLSVDVVEGDTVVFSADASSRPDPVNFGDISFAPQNSVLTKTDYSIQIETLGGGASGLAIQVPSGGMRSYRLEFQFIGEEISIYNHSTTLRINSTRCLVSRSDGPDLETNYAFNYVDTYSITAEIMSSSTVLFTFRNETTDEEIQSSLATYIPEAVYFVIDVYTPGDAIIALFNLIGDMTYLDPVGYSWQLDGVEVATTADYSRVMVLSDNGKDMTCVVTDPLISVTSDAIPITIEAAQTLTITNPGDLTISITPVEPSETEIESYDGIIESEIDMTELSNSMLGRFVYEPSTTNKISIIEKISRLSDLRDPYLVDDEYLSVFASDLGYNINMGFNYAATFADGGINSDDIRSKEEIMMNIRHVIKSLPYWYKIKSIPKAFVVLLYSYGLVGELVAYYTKDHKNFITEDAALSPLLIGSGYYPTSHMGIKVSAEGSAEDEDYDIINKRISQAVRVIESIKPITMVLHAVTVSYEKNLAGSNAINMNISVAIRQIIRA